MVIAAEKCDTHLEYAFQATIQLEESRIFPRATEDSSCHAGWLSGLMTGVATDVLGRGERVGKRRKFNILTLFNFPYNLWVQSWKKICRLRWRIQCWCTGRPWRYIPMSQPTFLFQLSTNPFHSVGDTLIRSSPDATVRHVVGRITEIPFSLHLLVISYIW